MKPASHRDCHTRTDPEHTHRTTSTATNRAPYTCPIMTSALARCWHCKASIATQTLLPRDDQPPPAVHLSIPLLHRHRQQLHSQRIDAPLGMGPLSAVMSPRRFTNFTASLPMYPPACLNRKRHRPECSMIRNILPEPRPLGPFSPRRSLPSCLGSLSSVRLRRRVRNHGIHCRNLKPRQHRHDVAPALAFDHALQAPQMYTCPKQSILPPVRETEYTSPPLVNSAFRLQPKTSLMPHCRP